MALVLYNSLSRRKETFEPLDPKRVRIYVCGPTVYDRAHIGNARAVVVFDVLYRLLRDTFGAEHVRYVRNITDIDDKIIAASRESGEPIASLTERMTCLFHDDMASLGALPPDEEPRATKCVEEMKAMIARLLEKGCAYVADGHVLFAVAAAPHYGELSKKSRAELIDGARVEVAPYKRDPADFVLWKPSTPDLPGWDSPWGRGRPGWHIECSAMSEAYLGDTFDIHGGGVDLIFPHHENELAQSTCAHEGRPFARFWVHNGFLTADGRKMSKSLGNIRTVRELLDEDLNPGLRRGGEAIRLALLSTHYREPLDWTQEKLRQAHTSLFRFYAALARGRRPQASDAASGPSEVRDALDDDLNTPLALARLHELATSVNRLHEEDRYDERERAQTLLLAGGQLMGLLGSDPEEWLRGAQRGDAVLVDQLIADRAAARKTRNFAAADKIRARLLDLEIVLEDHPDGTTTWRRKM